MDAELREAIAGLMAMSARVAEDARDAKTYSSETSHAVASLTSKVDRLERAVFGSHPPPSDGVVAPITARVKASEGGLAELRTELAAVKKQNEEQLVLLNRIAEGVTTVTKSPLARRVGQALATAVIAWATYIAAKFHGVLR